MKKMKLSEANKQASNLIGKLISKEMDRNRNGKSSLTNKEFEMLFVIRDGHRKDILDPWELENYDNCYGIEIYN